MFEDIFVIDLTSSRLFTAWVVTNLEVCDFVPGPVDVGDQVAFGDLLVVNVKKNFARRAVHGLTYFITLGGLGEEQTGVIPEIERLQHHNQLVWFEDITSLFERFHYIGSLIAHVLSEIEVAGYHGHPGSIDPLGHFNRIFDLL